MDAKIERYNIRVYGIWIRDQRVLVTDEYRMGVKMTKFPGGGHHLGEGLGDTVKREWMEELNTPVEIGELIYINEFFQISAFSSREQILSVYFQVHPLRDPDIRMTTIPFDFESEDDGAQAFRWLEISQLSPNDFTFPIDKVVAEKLSEKKG